mmetsp:Transcript_18957/g.73040  ORF Transcript_18957/g.73040 Transcript_18957/m.73040 type:complete len:203 (+) Transcript_18957:165-773(+)
MHEAVDVAFLESVGVALCARLEGSIVLFKEALALDLLRWRSIEVAGPELLADYQLVGQALYKRRPRTAAADREGGACRLPHLLHRGGEVRRPGGEEGAERPAGVEGNAVPVCSLAAAHVLDETLEPDRRLLPRPLAVAAALAEEGQKGRMADRVADAPKPLEELCLVRARAALQHHHQRRPLTRRQPACLEATIPRKELHVL